MAIKRTLRAKMYNHVASDVESNEQPQRNIFAERRLKITRNPMRLLRERTPSSRLSSLAILAMICLMSLLPYDQAEAQSVCQDGVDFNTYILDTLRIKSFKGEPGDTVNMPIYLKADSVILALTANIRYNPTVLKPIVTPDTSTKLRVDSTILPWDSVIDTTINEFVDLIEVGRARILDTLTDALGFDSIVVRDLFRSASVKIRDSSIIKLQWLSKIPGQGVPLDSIPGGAGNIVNIRFEVLDAGLPINTSRGLSIEHLPVLDTSVFPPDSIGCALGATAQNWVVGFINPTPPPDTIYETLSLLQVPKLIGGFYVVGPKPVDECSLSVNCDPRAGFTVECVGGVCVYDTITAPVGCNLTSDCPPISGFTVQCVNNDCVYTKIPIPSHRPTVEQVTPNVISVTQGEMVSFTVTATDDSAAHVMTLSASGMPAGATFSSIPSTITATGDFNWTPSLSQFGSFAVSFTATDNLGNASATMSVTINVEKLDFDQLFTTSSVDMAPVGGIPGFNPVMFPIDLLSLQDSVYGIQFDLQYPHRQIEIDSIVTTDRTTDYVVDWMAMSDSLIRVVTLGLNNEAILPGTTTAVLNIALHIDSTAVAGTYDMTIFNGRESIDPNPAIGSVELLTIPGVVEVDHMGDVNLDKLIDVADMVNIIAFIIGNYNLPARNFMTADVTLNDSVDVVDLVGVNNLIFGLPISPAPSFTPGTGPSLATLALDQQDFNSGGFSAVSLVGDFPENVAGVEFHLDYDPATISILEPQLTDVSSEFRLRYRDDKNGKVRVVIYNSSTWNSESLIPEGFSEIMKLSMVSASNASADDVVLSNISLSNSEAGKIYTEEPVVIVPETFALHQNFPNPFNPQTTISFAIDADEDGASMQHVKLNIYNILGQRVKTLIDRPMAPSTPNNDYKVVWDGRSKSGSKVATGVYLYRLQVGKEKFSTKKMVLLK